MEVKPGNFVEAYERAMPQPMTEVARSYTRKTNLGNYESMDFFCSQKLEVPLDQAEAASERLIQFCRSQVTKDIQTFMAERKAGK